MSVFVQSTQFEFSKNSKICVFTCVTGGYDSIRTPALQSLNIDYHCWTDNPNSVPNPWHVHCLESNGKSAKDLNRYIKINIENNDVLNKYGTIIYVDGSISIIGDLSDLVNRSEGDFDSVYAYDHPFRNCTYDEAFECARIGHDWLPIINRQMVRYAYQGLPRRCGLFECNVLVIRPGKSVYKMFAAWWKEYEHGAKRDQLSFVWSAIINNVQIRSLGASDPRFSQKKFRLEPHTQQNLGWLGKLRRLANLILMIKRPNWLKS